MLHTLFISVSPEHSPGFSVFHRPESGNPKTIRPIPVENSVEKLMAQPFSTPGGQLPDKQAAGAA